MIVITIRCFYRKQTHWWGRYTKEDFEEKVEPVLKRINAEMTQHLISVGARTYIVRFGNKAGALAFRKEFTQAFRSLGHRRLATFGIDIAEG